MGNKSAKYKSDTVEKANLKPGDLLKIKRSTCSGLRAFYHFAVYIGGEEVIHLTKIKEREYCKCPDEATFVEGNTATECQHCGKPYRFVVASEPLKTVLKDNEFTVANNRDKKNKPLPSDQIIAIARSFIGPVKYCFSQYNCEHFANWCRYNIAVSRQSTIRWFNGSKFVLKLKKGVKVTSNAVRSIVNRNHRPDTEDNNNQYCQKWKSMESYFLKRSFITWTFLMTLPSCLPHEIRIMTN